MTWYQLINVIGQALIVVIPVIIVFFKKGKVRQTSVAIILSFASSFLYDFRLFGFSLMQILLVIIVLTTKEKNTKKIDPELGRLKKLLVFYITYHIIVTVVGYAMRSDYVLKGSIIQNELRPVVQSVQMAFLYTVVFICSRFDSATATTIIKTFHKALIVFAVIGVVQTVLYALTGFDILPMRKDFVSETQGLSVTAGNGLLRATGGVGEPKQYAKIMALGMAIEMLLYKVIGRSRVKWSNVALFGVAIFFSSSTTGFIIAFVILLIYFLQKVKRNGAYIAVAIVVLSIAIPLILGSPVVADKLQAQENNGVIMGLEDTDSATAEWLINEPKYLLFGTGISNTVAYANKYVAKSFSYINRYPYTLRRGLIKNLAEGGIVGLILQMMLMLCLYGKFKRNPDLKHFGLFIIVMYFFLTCEAIIEVEMILLALLGSLDSDSKRKRIEYENIAG